MSILNIVCPICTEVFGNADDIYSTSCGHIFHFICMNQWKTKGTSCPQCRSYNPTTHKLYLSFDESAESLEKLEEMQIKLKSSNEKNAQLMDQINETDFNFLHVQEQFTIAEQRKKELEERIKQMNDSEDNFLNLQFQYTESSELVKELQDQIQRMVIENERKTKELRLKNLEIDSLRVGINAGQSNLSDNNLSDKVRILEQKLKHISEEFKKEITISTQLSIDKMKLQSYIDHLKSAENATIMLKQSRKKNNFTEKLENPKKDSFVKEFHNKNPKQKCDQFSDAIVIIKDVPSDQLTKPYKNVIVSLASKMSMAISPNDVVEVNLVGDNNASSTVQLSAQFKNRELKNRFLFNKNILKNDPSTSSIILGDYMNDQNHSLFVYAKEKLRGNGYNHVFYKNNMVFAKKYKSHPKVVRIYNMEHADKLQKQNKSLESETAPDLPPAKSTKGDIDKNFYQL